MNLKLVLKETGQSWTLEPTRDYIVGADRTCDINLSQYPDVASRHLRLSCDRAVISRLLNTWVLVNRYCLRRLKSLLLIISDDYCVL